MNVKDKRVFHLKSPMIYFRSAKKVSCYLVRDKIYPFERSVGLFKYSKKY